MPPTADRPSNAPSPGSPDTAAESSASAASPSAQTASRPPRFALLIATGFGLGYLPKAPGTWGSLLGVVLVWLTGQIIPPGVGGHGPPQTGDVAAFIFLPVMLIVARVGVWAASWAAKQFSTKDPQAIVIDEVSGQFITFLGGSPFGGVAVELPLRGGVSALWPFPVHWHYLLAGFILFRVFDIWKPWPVRAAEKLPGGWGIMADDWVAGIYAALCLWGLRALGL